MDSDNEERDGQVTKAGGITRRELLKTAALGGAALAGGSMLAGALGQAALAAGGGFPPAHPKWRFVFVNHVTTNPFFVPTQYGIEDACNLLGCNYQWTGSTTSDVSQMVNAIETAIAGRADGIATSIIDPKAFNAPIAAAIKAGIPVVSYNADAPANSGNQRMAYIGQDLFVSGQMMGQRIEQLVPAGSHIGLFIATPGSLNIQPRIDGAVSVLKSSSKKITWDVVATGALVEQELSAVESYYLGHKSVKGMFAVDAGSTQSVGQTMAKYNLHKQGVYGGGFDLLPLTLQYINQGILDFTIDQQPYQQGFYPVVELFLYKLSGTLMSPSEMDTGLKFITKATVGPYLRTKSRFEGSSQAELNLGG
jgi:simple sugar transport system substrate-binding protein